MTTTYDDARAQLLALERAVANALDVAAEARAAAQFEPTEASVLAEFVAERRCTAARRDLETARAAMMPVLRQQAIDKARSDLTAARSDLLATRQQIADEQASIAEAERAIEAASARITQLTFERKRLEETAARVGSWLEEHGRIA